MTSPTIRPYQPGDETGIAEAHRQSIYRIACRDYTPQQLEGWAGRISPEKYVDSMHTKGETFWVIDDNGTIAGFAGYLPGRMYGFYIHPDYAGRGLGRQLFAAAENDMRTRAPTSHCEIDATLTARPFYEKMGFEVVEPALHTFANGVQLEIVKMRKTYQPETEPAR